MSELLIGCGNSREKRLVPHDAHWEGLVTLDITGEPDVTHDLEVFPYPFEDESFNEIHAYEVLEHTGSQGDTEFFFGQFNELRRILRTGGYLCLSVPLHTSIWAMGDPGHKRVLPRTVFSFLTKDHYNQVGKTACADYRHLINGYWVIKGMQERGESLYVLLQK